MKSRGDFLFLTVQVYIFVHYGVVLTLKLSLSNNIFIQFYKLQGGPGTSISYHDAKYPYWDQVSLNNADSTQGA